ncbi:hypothetical protein TCAL_00155 [Tigriopus californicus]|uniref:Acetyl-CoA acetyltransferase n=1 Tax=Tigriopus californicus TaxID=6832 RepID=A0A553PGH2_TIGCA|nr:hypothetical protein TCAL_00155 [Tigriopus californicus]
MNSDRCVIVAAARTPIGNFLGALAKVSSPQLGSHVISEVLKRSAVPPEELSEVIMGQVLQAGQGQNPARQAAWQAGVPFQVPAMNVSMVCGSGLKAVMLADQAIRGGEAEVVVAGGQESMSQAPHAMNIRNPTKFGHAELVDLLLQDGLTDAFSRIHMGITAENVAARWNISREEQDQFAADSQAKAKIAQDAGHFDQEIVPYTITGRRGELTVVAKDEFPKPETTVDGLKKLRPAFKPSDGTVTAGNASGINDGAAAVLVMSEKEALKRNLVPLVRIVASASVGLSPEIMGTGPIPAVKKAISKAGWSIDEVDLFELNEAFAAQSIAVVRDLKIDPKKVNVSGGAIALGHPIGASERLNMKKGVASLCIGGGMGVAMCVERP